MKSIFKGALSALIALCLLLTSTVAPANAYADGLNGLGSSSTHSVSPLNVKGNHNPITIQNYFFREDYAPKKPKSFRETVTESAGKTIEYASYAVFVCQTADFLAGKVFPPAEALKPACSLIPRLVPMTKGAQGAFRGARAIAR